MTAAELIELLKNVPDETPIVKSSGVSLFAPIELYHDASAETDMLGKTWYRCYGDDRNKTVVIIK